MVGSGYRTQPYMLYSPINSLIIILLLFMNILLINFSFYKFERKNKRTFKSTPYPSPSQL